MSLFPCFFVLVRRVFGRFSVRGGKKHHKKRLDKKVMSIFLQNIEPEKMSVSPSIFYRVFGCFSVLGKAIRGVQKQQPYF
jgi:hypothetical protein